jgi:hypothetical protein
VGVELPAYLGKLNPSVVPVAEILPPKTVIGDLPA